jgi:pyruvate,water dikinase
MTLPVSFTGMPEPMSTSRTQVVEIAGSPRVGGATEGRARVVVDPNEDVEPDEGDVLVCTFTIPAGPRC